MYLVLLFSLQFYFLARIFKKDKLKTILTVIGLYFACSIFFGFVLVILFMTKTIDIGIDFPKNPSPDAMNSYSEAMQDYLMHSKISVIIEVLKFILIGIVYFSYLKRKWAFQALEKEIALQQEVVLNVAQTTIFKQPKLDVYLHFHTVNEKNIHLVQPLAREIWNECYKNILNDYQINYMIDLMYNPNKVNEGIANGETWEILKIDNIPSGYLHYYFNKEENIVYLSKIYLKSNNQTKGIGQMMMNRVIDFAYNNNAKFVELTVNKNNQKAIRFYEKNGFRNVESKVFEIGNGYVMDDYIYRKTL